ncbi:MAG TPA: MEDS domain-containing protein [Gemmatimonadaceae bacterium]|nr:MEDS domain-containing protein [Gemmatimonadaceae bacterium]
MTELGRSLSMNLSESRSLPIPTPPGVTGHDVHFYKNDSQLSRAVVHFLSDAIRVGQPIIVIATEAHRKAFSVGLRDIGLDPDRVLSGRLAIWLDAQETLASFMEGGMPNPELFTATVGSVFARLLDKRHYLVVRAYGEMVDLLWKSGNCEGACALEQLWNDLANKYKYSLLCGYSVENFLHETGAEGLRRVCGHHTNVLPPEYMDEVA